MSMKNESVVYALVTETMAVTPANVTTPPTLSSYMIFKDNIERVFAYLTLCTVMPGVTGNILTIIVLTQKNMRSSTNVYLTALAVWDCMVILTAMILMGWFVMYPMTLAPCITIVYPVALTAQTATIWITVSFTVERFIAVKYPLKAASMCTVKRARTVIASLSLSSVTYNLPRWFEYYPFTLIQWLNEHKIYREVYFIWLYLPVMLLIPLSALAVMNVFLIRAVRESKRQRQDMNVRQTRENNVTLMLISVVVVFIICQVPALVYNMVYAIDAEVVITSKSYILLSSFRNFLVVLNSTVNFLLYCAFGQKFRKTFCELFLRCCLKDAPDRQHSFSYMSNHAGNPTRVVASKKYFKIPTSQPTIQCSKFDNLTMKSSSTTKTSSDESALHCIENRHAIASSPGLNRSAERSPADRSPPSVHGHPNGGVTVTVTPQNNVSNTELGKAGILASDRLAYSDKRLCAEELELIEMGLLEPNEKDPCLGTTTTVSGRNGALS